MKIIGNFLLVCVLLGSHVVPASQQIPMLVSPEQNEDFIVALNKIFPGSRNYEVGLRSDFLLLVDKSEVKITMGRGAVAKLTVIKPTGTKLLQAEAMHKISFNDYHRSDDPHFKRTLPYIEKAKIKALSQLKRQRKSIQSSAKNNQTDWLALYDSLYVAKAINRSIWEEHLNTTLQSSYNPDFFEAGTYVSLLHRYIALENINAVRAMLPHLELYGGDYPTDKEMTIRKAGKIVGFPKGNHLIHTAAFTGNAEIFELVYSAYPELHAKNAYGLSPLQMAATSNLKIFIKVAQNSPKKAKPYLNDALVFTIINNPKPTQELINQFDQLIELGADVNQVQSSTGWQPMHFAAKVGSIEFIDILHQRGANLSMPTNQTTNATPLSVAIKNGHESVGLHLLTYGVDTIDSKRHKPTLLMMAIDKNMPIIAEVLIRDGVPLGASDNHKQSPLIEAIDQGMIQIAQLIIEAGGNPNDKAEDNRRALSVALSKGYNSLADTLLQNGANPNLVFSGGTSLLHRAIEDDQRWLVERLLAARANPNIKDNKGRTPLHLAYPSATKNLDAKSLELISLLIANGADAGLKNNAGQTAENQYQKNRQAFLDRQYKKELAAIAAREVAREAAERRRIREQEAQARRLAQQRQQQARRKTSTYREPDIWGAVFQGVAQGLVQGAQQYRQAAIEGQRINDAYARQQRFYQQQENERRRIAAQQAQQQAAANKQRADRERQLAAQRHRAELERRQAESRRRQERIAAARTSNSYGSNSSSNSFASTSNSGYGSRATTTSTFSQDPDCTGVHYEKFNPYDRSKMSTAEYQALRKKIDAQVQRERERQMKCASRAKPGSVIRE